MITTPAKASSTGRRPALKATLLLALASCATSASAGADTAAGSGDAADAATRQHITEAVQRATGTAPATVTPSASLPGYYEVRARNGAFAYVDADARRLIKGQVIDLATGENLTLSRLPGAPARIDTSALPLADAITTVAGKGERELVVFVDPNCSYCRALEPELGKLGNVRVRRYVLPMLGPGSEAVARNVWCAVDRPAAWRQAVAARPVAAAPPGCDAGAMARNLALARRLGISATPTIVFPGGDRVVATLPAEEIERRLAGTALALGR